MNILFLNDPGFDYMSSQLCEGFHLLSKDGDLKFKVLHTTTHHGCQVDDLIPTTVKEAMASVMWADYILFSSAGGMAHIKGDIKKVFEDKSLKHKRVFIDGHDGDALLTDPSLHLVYFKREMRIPECNQSIHWNIRSLVFGVFNFLIEGMEWLGTLEEDWEKRDIDVAFMAYGGSHPTRPQCAEALEKIASERGWKLECHVMADGQPIPSDRYHEILYRSKIGISLPGAGFDTNRFWEVPGHGAVLASLDLETSIRMRHGFEAQRHCIYFKSWQAMAELCHAVVTDKARWMQIRRAADDQLRFHTTRSRAREILQICGELSSVKTLQDSCST